MALTIMRLCEVWEMRRVREACSGERWSGVRDATRTARGKRTSGRCKSASDLHSPTRPCGLVVSWMHSRLLLYILDEKVIQSHDSMFDDQTIFNLRIEMSREHGLHESSSIREYSSETSRLSSVVICRGDCFE